MIDHFTLDTLSSLFDPAHGKTAPNETRRGMPSAQ